MLYPIMTETRQVIDLNGIWNFKLDKGTGFEEKWNEKTTFQKIRFPLIMGIITFLIGLLLSYDSIGFPLKAQLIILLFLFFSY